MDGIATNELDYVKMQIMATLALTVDFDACVILYKDFIAQKTAWQNMSFTVSAVNIGDKGGGSLQPGWTVTIPPRSTVNFLLSRKPCCVT